MSFETSAVLLCFKSAPIITEEHYQYSVIVPMTPSPTPLPSPLLSPSYARSDLYFYSFLSVQLH